MSCRVVLALAAAIQMCGAVVRERQIVVEPDGMVADVMRPPPEPNSLTFAPIVARSSENASVDSQGMQQDDSRPLLSRRARFGQLKWAGAPWKCFDLAGGKTHNGAWVTMWDCHNAAHPDVGNQQWSLPDSGTGQIRWAPHGSLDFNRCLDIAHGKTHNGAGIISWQCHPPGHPDLDHQLFTMPEGGQGQIRWIGADWKCMDVDGGKTHNGNGIHLWDCHDAAHPHARHQQWILPGSDGSVGTAAQSGHNSVQTQTPFQSNNGNIQTQASNGHNTVQTYMPASPTGDQSNAYNTNPEQTQWARSNVGYMPK